jgi:eukaryotic-like serine/threonine-protein kinase
MATEQDDSLARAKTRLGSVLRGKYRLDSVLGIGGMAAVYKATHRNQAEFAIKMLHPELSIRGDVRQRFLREGYAANSVKHPGVVLVVDDDVAEDGAAFLVMELVHGQDVDALCDRSQGRLPADAVLSIGHQLLDVLVAAHGKGIVHRDIKPANLFVTTSGALKVLDFGIARARDVAVGAGAATGTGMVLGTPAFMSPEQALAASDIDAQTDVWAVGATLFRLLSGRMVHEGENAQQLMIKTATTPPRSLGSLLSDAPARLIEVVDKGLAFDKSQRWASAAEMRDAVAAVARELFGALPLEGALAPLVERARTEGGPDRAEVALAATESVDKAPPPRASAEPPTTPSPAVAARTPPGVGSSGADGRPQPIQSTASPVSREATLAVSTRGAKRRILVPVLAVGAVATLALAATLRVRTAAPPSIASSASSVIAASVPTVPPLVAMPAPEARAQPTATSSVPTPSVKAPGYAAAATRPATHTASRPAAAPSAPSTTPKCHLTTWIDNSGETHAKQVCE